MSMLKENEEEQKSLVTPQKHASSVYVPAVTPSPDKSAKPDFGRTVSKIAKALTKQIEKKTPEETLIALFSKLDEALNKWKKSMGIPNKEDKQKKEESDLSRIFMEQIQAMKSQIERLDYEKSQLNLENDKLLKKIDEDRKRVEEIKHILKTQGKLVINEVQTPVQELKDTEAHLRSRITELEDISRNNIIKSDQEIDKLKDNIAKLNNDIMIYKQEIEKNDPNNSKFKQLQIKNDSLNDSIIQMDKTNRELTSEIEKGQRQIAALNEELVAQQQKQIPFEESKNKINKLIEEKNDFEKTIEDLDTQCSNSKYLLTKLTVLLSEKEDSIAKLRSDLSLQINKVEEGTNNYQALLEGYKKIEEQRGGMVENLANANQKIKEYSQKIDEANKATESMTLLKIERDTANSNFDSSKKKIETLSANQEKLEKLLQTANENVTSLRRLNEEFTMKEKVWNQKEKELREEVRTLSLAHTSDLEKISEIVKQKQISQNSLDSALLQLDNIKSALKEKEVLLEKSSLSIEEYKKSINQNTTEISNLKSQLEGKYKLQEINKEEANLMSKKVNELNTIIDSLKVEQIKSKERMNECLTELEKEKLEKTQEISSKEKQIKLLQIENDELKELAKHAGKVTNQEDNKCEIESLNNQLKQKEQAILYQENIITECKKEITQNIAQNKLQFDTLEAQLNEKIVQLTQKNSELESEKIVLSSKLQYAQIKPTSNSDDSQFSDLLKENTDLQMNLNSIKLEKAKIEIQLNRANALIIKEKQAKDVINDKFTKSLSDQIEKEVAIKSITSKYEVVSKELREKESLIKQINADNDCYKDKQTKSDLIIREYIVKLSNLEEQVKLSSISAQRTLIGMLAEIKLPDGTKLWDIKVPYPGSMEDVIKKVELLFVSYDKKYRYQEEEKLCSTVIELCQYCILNSKENIDKAGIKCDNINSLIDTKALCDQSPKDNSLWNKLKGMVPFLSSIVIDSKNKESICRVLHEYVNHKQKRLQQVQTGFGQARKMSLAMELKKEDHVKMAEMLGSKLEK